MTKFKNFQNENSLKIENYKLKIVFFGTPNYLDPIIQTLEKNFDLVKIIRSTSDSLDSLTHLNPDLFVVASFGKIIPAEILNIPKLGSINIHPSRLPKYRGPSPIQSQILGGVSESAISFILMDEEMDHGPILFQEDFQILENDTFESLCIKMFAKSAESLPKVISEFAEGKLKPMTQNHAMASYCVTLKKEAGYFPIENPPDSETLDRMIRAYYPWPGVYTKWNGRIVKFLPEGKIQMEGKKAIDLKSFLNGYPDFPLKEF